MEEEVKGERGAYRWCLKRITAAEHLTLKER